MCQFSRKNALCNEWSLESSRLTVVHCVQGREFADQYRLEYQREDDGPWFKFRNRLGREVSVTKEILYNEHCLCGLWWCV